MTDYFYTDNLESKRLRTKFLTFDDLDAWATFFDDKEAVEFFPDLGLSSKERAKLWIEKQMGRYADKTYGLQAAFLEVK